MIKPTEVRRPDVFGALCAQMKKFQYKTNLSADEEFLMMPDQALVVPLHEAWVESSTSPDVSGAHITLIGERRVPDLNAMPMLWSVLVHMVPRATDLFLGPRRRCSTLRKRQAPSPLMCRKSSSPTYAAPPRVVRHVSIRHGTCSACKIGVARVREARQANGALEDVPPLLRLVA